MNDMNRKEILTDDLLFTKVGWIYQYNAIPNNKDNQLTNHFSHEFEPSNDLVNNIKFYAKSILD